MYKVLIHYKANNVILIKIGLIILLLVLLTPATHANQQVTFCYSPQTSLAISDAPGKPAHSGYLYDIQQAIFAEIKGYTPIIYVLPWKTCQSSALRGVYDGVSLMITTEERKRKYAFTDYMFKYKQRLFYSKTKYPKGIHWNKIEDLKKYKFGIVHGSEYGDTISAHIASGLFPSEYTQIEIQNLHKLNAHRIDVFPNQLLFIKPLIKEAGLEGKIAWTEQVLYEEPVSISFPKSSKYKYLIKDINKVLAKLKSNGTIDRIMAKEY